MRDDMPKIKTRRLTFEDAESWYELWQSYLEFHDIELPYEVTQTTFARLITREKRGFRCIVADLDGRVAGFAHYMIHRHNFRIENVCLLQDLYVSPELRGIGVGSALVKGVYKRADRMKAPYVYWQARHNNEAGIGLSTKFGREASFLKFVRKQGEE